MSVPSYPHPRFEQLEYHLIPTFPLPPTATRHVVFALPALLCFPLWHHEVSLNSNENDCNSAQVFPATGSRYPLSVRRPTADNLNYKCPGCWLQYGGRQMWTSGVRFLGSSCSMICTLAPSPKFSSSRAIFK